MAKVDFVIDGFIFEVETSLKRGKARDLETRIARAKKRVLIVVPNDETGQKYIQFAQQGKVDVIVFYELGYFLDHNNPTSPSDLTWQANQTNGQ